MALKRADECATFTFGAESRIHFEKTPGANFDELAGHTGRFRIGGLAYEDDVDVGDVVQFARTALPHRDDRQPGIHSIVVWVHRGDGYRECRCERCVGEIRYCGRDLDESHRMGHRALFVGRRRGCAFATVLSPVCR